MLKIVAKTLTIIDKEIFKKSVYRLLINIVFFIFVLALQFGDITLQISGNYFMIIWVAVNTYFVFSLFIKKEREYILNIGKLRPVKIMFLMFVVSILINIHWLAFLFAQLLVFFEASILNTVIIGFIQYFFAISLGIVCGTLCKKNIGIFIIGIYGIYNFIVCNPYNYDGMSHLFYCSESLFTVNQLNTSNIEYMIIMGISFIVFSYIFLYKRKRKIVYVIIAGIILVSSIMLKDLIKYNKTAKGEYKNYICDKSVIYKGLDEETVSEILEIVQSLKQEYSVIEPSKGLKEYDCRIETQYLPSLIWKLGNKIPEPILIHDDEITINITSRNMIYFQNKYLLRNFIEEVNWALQENVKMYDMSKYSKHIINGYGMRILEEVTSSLKVDEENEVYKYYRDYMNKMIDVPATNYNFVKKIGYIIYRKYPERASEIYESILENKPKTDRQFIELIEKNFYDIRYDKEIQCIIKKVEVSNNNGSNL